MFEKYGRVLSYKHDGRVASVKFATKEQCEKAYYAEKKNRLTYEGKECELSMLSDKKPALDSSRYERQDNKGFGHAASTSAVSSRFGSNNNNNERPSYNNRSRSASPPPAPRRDDRRPSFSRGNDYNSRREEPVVEKRRDYTRSNNTRDSDDKYSSYNRSNEEKSSYDLRREDKPSYTQERGSTGYRRGPAKKGKELSYPFKEVPEVVVFIEEVCFDRHMDFLRRKLIDGGYTFGVIKKNDSDIISYAKKSLHVFAQRGTEIALAITSENIDQKEFIDRAWQLMKTPGSFNDYIETEYKDMTPFGVVKAMGGYMSPIPKKGKKPKPEPEEYPRPMPINEEDDSCDEISYDILEAEFGKGKSSALFENHFGDMESDEPSKKHADQWPKSQNPTVYKNWMDSMNQKQPNLNWAEWPDSVKKSSKNNHLLWQECQVKENPVPVKPVVTDPRRARMKNNTPPTPTPPCETKPAAVSGKNEFMEQMAQMNPAQMQLMMNNFMQMQMMMGQMNPAMMESFMASQPQQQAPQKPKQQETQSFDNSFASMMGMGGMNPMNMNSGFPSFPMDNNAAQNNNNSGGNKQSELQIMNQLLKSMQ